MKRNTKTILAFVLTLLLIATFPVAVFADTPTSGTISGSSTVDNVIVNVILPTDLSFALDPLGLDTTGDNQIATQDFFFVNQTFAPVKVSIDIDAETSGGAVLVSTTGGLSLDDTNVTDKEIYFGALGATGLTGASITSTTAGISYSAIFGSTTGPAATYSTVSAVAATLSTLTPGADGTTGSAVISFALDKAVESATSEGSIEALAGDTGVAAFQFYSQLNTYAEWAAGDISVSGSYTLIPLRDTTYSGYEYIAGSLNQLVPEVAEEPETPVTPVGFTSGAGVTTTSINVAALTSGSAFTVPFNFGSTTFSSITTGTGNTLAVDQYSTTTGSITFVASRVVALKNISASTFYTIHLGDSSTYVINWIK